MDDNKILYRVALQLYIEGVEKEDEDIPTPTIEEAKVKVDHLIEVAKAGEAAEGKTFEIFKNDSQTAKVVVIERGDRVEIVYELEDTDSGLLYDRKIISLPKGVLKQVANYIVDM